MKLLLFDFGPERDFFFLFWRRVGGAEFVLFSAAPPLPPPPPRGKLLFTRVGNVGTCTVHAAGGDFAMGSFFCFACGRFPCPVPFGALPRCFATSLFFSSSLFSIFTALKGFLPELLCWTSVPVVVVVAVVSFSAIVLLQSHSGDRFNLFSFSQASFCFFFW